VANVSIYNLANELTWLTQVIEKKTQEEVITLRQIPADICYRLSSHLDHNDNTYQLTVNTGSRLKVDVNEVNLSSGYFEITVEELT
jgi:hypothetical protein